MILNVKIQVIYTSTETAFPKILLNHKQAFFSLSAETLWLVPSRGPCSLLSAWSSVHSSLWMAYTIQIVVPHCRL